MFFLFDWKIMGIYDVDWFNVGEIEIKLLISIWMVIVVRRRFIIFVSICNVDVLIWLVKWLLVVKIMYISKFSNIMIKLIFIWLLRFVVNGLVMIIVNVFGFVSSGILRGIIFFIEEDWFWVIDLGLWCLGGVCECNIESLIKIMIILLVIWKVFWLMLKNLRRLLLIYVDSRRVMVNVKVVFLVIVWFRWGFLLVNDK